MNNVKNFLNSNIDRIKEVIFKGIKQNFIAFDSN